MKAVTFRDPAGAKGDKLWRFVEIPASVQTHFNALSLGTSTFLIDAEHLFSISHDSLYALLTE